MRMWDAASEGVPRGVLHGSCVAFKSVQRASGVLRLCCVFMYAVSVGVMGLICAAGGGGGVRVCCCLGLLWTVGV